MKTRNGFVSNSSSSSFIIAADKNTKTIPIVIKADLMQLIENTIRTEEDIAEYIDNCWGYKTYEEAKEEAENGYGSALKLWDKMREALASGKEVLIGSGSNEDDNPISLEIYEHGLKNIKMPANIDFLEDER